MTTLEELARRVDDLERVAKGGIRRGQKVFTEDVRLVGNQLIWVRCDKDGDKDYDPYTSTSWDGDSFSNEATGTIDWVADFGLPEKPKMVSVMVYNNDSGSAGTQCYISLMAKSTTTNPSLDCICPRSGNDHLGVTSGVVAVASDGTSYYSVVASGSSTMDVTIRVVAYAK